MCGRFAQTDIIKATSEIVKSVIGKVDNIDNFNISPGQEAAVIKKYSNGRALELAKFSIIPSWASDKEGFRPLHNTRVESLTTKPYFKRLVTENRLLIPCSYFYEWTKSEDNKKVPYCFKNKEDELMYFAGLYEKDMFSIITIESKNKIHHRQPLIINKSKINDYLNLKNNASEVLRSIKPPELDYYQIGPEINNPKNNYKELIYPLPK